ncbi:MAG: diguanylate cyclase [Lachnospiraceae bacterium]|nr:diguanylate cyclase [Lachnospiraceae bacterium]
MRKIWEFFDTMDELVYVSDMDNYDLVYMNQKALRTYGFHSLEEIVKKKCHEVTRHCSVPCSMCNNQELRPGHFKEWCHYDSILGRQMMFKDTMIKEDGKKYRMKIAVDVGKQEQWDSMMNLETKINEGIRIALQQETPSQTLEVLLAHMGKALDCERTYIFERNERGCDDNTYEWVASGVTPEKDNLQNLPAEVCANWYQNFRIGRHIVIKKLEDIRESDPLQYENLKRQNIRSLVVVPLYNEGEVIGFYGIDNPPEKLLDYVSDMLQIMAHFIISSLKQRNLIQKLKEMSYCDQLTQIGNRHAMIEYINNLQNGQSLGIVYCDVTGLKQTNDQKGHDAGDKLLINACECLKKSFGEYGLFRVGGDELLAICAGIGEEALFQGVKQLKNNLRDKSVHMAVGSIWEKDSFNGVNQLIAEAEKRMYRDKAAYYKKYGVDRRHSLEVGMRAKS